MLPRTYEELRVKYEELQERYNKEVVVHADAAMDILRDIMAMSEKDKRECFPAEGHTSGYLTIYEIISKYNYNDLVNIIDDFKRIIRVGDEVCIKDVDSDYFGDCGIVFDIEDSDYLQIFIGLKGMRYVYESIDDVEKTGRHVDIMSLFDNLA